MPEDSGGASSKRSVASTARVSRRASTGLPSVGSPTGTSPTQCAWPSRLIRVALEPAPMNDQRDQIP